MPLGVCYNIFTNLSGAFLWTFYTLHQEIICRIYWIN